MFSQLNFIEIILLCFFAIIIIVFIGYPILRIFFKAIFTSFFEARSKFLVTQNKKEE